MTVKSCSDPSSGGGVEEGTDSARASSSGNSGDAGGTIEYNG